MSRTQVEVEVATTSPKRATRGAACIVSNLVKVAHCLVSGGAEYLSIFNL
jgi:hypothetical protein